jgi:uncharacterized lipoprotein NlpE involved in copper resistance
MNEVKEETQKVVVQAPNGVMMGMNEQKELTPEEAQNVAAQASSTKVTMSFKGMETYMAHNGIMMEREVFYLIPETALRWPNPHQYAMGETYGKSRPKGKLFTGKNRKERRKELKVGKTTKY